MCHARVMAPTDSDEEPKIADQGEGVSPPLASSNDGIDGRNDRPLKCAGAMCCRTTEMLQECSQPVPTERLSPGRRA